MANLPAPRYKLYLLGRMRSFFNHKGEALDAKARCLAKFPHHAARIHVLDILTGKIY
jgi:hypothetical protein